MFKYLVGWGNEEYYPAVDMDEVRDIVDDWMQEVGYDPAVEIYLVEVAKISKASPIRVEFNEMEFKDEA